MGKAIEVVTKGEDGREVTLDCVLRAGAAEPSFTNLSVAVKDEDLLYSVQETEQTVTQTTPWTFRVDETGEVLTLVQD